MGQHCRYCRAGGWDGDDEGWLAVTAVTAQLPRPLVMMESSGCVMDTVPAQYNLSFGVTVIVQAGVEVKESIINSKV